MPRFAASAGILALFLAVPAAAGDAACKPEFTETAHVRAVLDGRALTLSDGREVRLSGLEAAKPGDEAARKALESLVLGREIRLLKSGAETDRYGRVLAFAAVESPETVQETLLAQGHVRASADVDRNCAKALMKAEETARTAGLGLWKDPYYLIRQAEDPAGILAVRGHFAVVEGRVLSVRESGSTIYVNFGRRWSEDFTVTVQKRQERAFTAAGLDLKTLAGQQVRVRGTIEERGGPWIEAAHPGQIEIAERGP